MNISINPKRTVFFLLILIGMLLAAHIVSQIAIFKYGVVSFEEWIRLVSFNGERNFPAFYSAFALLLSSIMLFLIGKWHGRNHYIDLQWYVLGAIFLYLAIDESTSIHENLVTPLRRLTRSTGILSLPWLAWISSNGYVLKTLLNYIWMVPYGIGILLVGIIFIRFAKILPRNTLGFLVISGLIYLSGAIGFELASGFEIAVHSEDTVLYSVLSTIEELLEMLGIALFNYALLDYAADNIKAITLNIN